MSTLTKEQVMTKLEKLLTLAGNKGATEAEMNTAMAKATELARAYNIDLASVDTDGEVKVEEMETDFAVTNTKTKQEQPYHMPIIYALRAVFGVKPFLATYTDHNQMRHITRITWIGEKVDVAMAVYCWGWLENLFPKCWLDYRKANGIADNYVSKRSYFTGLSEGIQAANRRAVESMGADRNKYALVLVNKEAIVTARAEAMFGKPKGHVKSFTTQSDNGSRAAGYAKGSTIKLNGGLTGGSARQSLT